HAGASADVDHLALGRFDMEIAERTDARDDIPRLEAEDVAGADARRAILPRRRRRDAHVEPQYAFCLLVAGQRVVISATRFKVASNQIEDVLPLPYGGKRLGNIEIT